MAGQRGLPKPWALERDHGLRLVREVAEDRARWECACGAVGEAPMIDDAARDHERHQARACESTPTLGERVGVLVQRVRRAASRRLRG